MLAKRFSTTGTLTKCKMHIIHRQEPIANKNQYVKIWNMFSFWWEGAKWTLARNNLSALWVGNCNCFILVFIMNMHPLLLLDNSQSKGSGLPLAKKIGYRDGSGRVVRKFYRQKANIWEINVRQIIIIANGINSQTPKLQTALRFGHTEALLLKKI